MRRIHQILIEVNYNNHTKKTRELYIRIHEIIIKQNLTSFSVQQ